MSTTNHSELIAQARNQCAAIAVASPFSVDVFVRLAAALEASDASAANAEGALLRKGYRKTCDIPACNCGDNWTHGGHAEERLREIADVVWENGRTVLQSVEALKQRAEKAEAELATARKDSERLKVLRDLMGHVQNASDTTITLSQDDATRDYIVSIGRDGKNVHYGTSLGAAIDAAMQANSPQS